MAGFKFRRKEATGNLNILRFKAGLQLQEVKMMILPKEL